MPTRSTETSNSSVIVVSAVSLLLIVILITVIIIQCLLILRMRKSKDADSTIRDNERVSVSLNQEYTNSSKHMDVPVTPNVAYSLHKTITSQSEDMHYEVIAD